MTLAELKETVCQANLDLVDHGLVTLTWGNVSGLAEDGDVFAIKPSGVSYKKLKPKHVVIVSVASGDVLEGDLRPSSDTPTHRLLYPGLRRRGRDHPHTQPPGNRFCAGPPRDPLLPAPPTPTTSTARCR